uniref:Uncharacterized protein n=1 Tax=Entomoneis paludosa TaxID=265537 RepID=A0A7S2YJX6_9STRA
MSDISNLWDAAKQEERQLVESCAQSDSLSVVGNPCSLTWICAPTDIFEERHLKQIMGRHLLNNQGWGTLVDKKHGWANKLGWEVLPAAKGSSTLPFFTMQLTNLTVPVRVVTFFYMKSYGDKWANSQAKVAISGSDSSTNVTEAPPPFVRMVEGYHNQNVSISYTETMVLPIPIAKGQNLTLQVEMVNGTAFKIQGMMFCSR